MLYQLIELTKIFVHMEINISFCFTGGDATEQRPCMYICVAWIDDMFLRNFHYNLSIKSN